MTSTNSARYYGYCLSEKRRPSMRPPKTKREVRHEARADSFRRCLALTLVPLGSAETSYSDASGDAGTVPDITTTAVSNTDDGVVTFRVTANMAPNTLLFANLDTDANPGTGSYGTDRMLAFGLMPSGAIVPLVFDANGTVVPGLAFR